MIGEQAAHLSPQEALLKCLLAGEPATLEMVDELRQRRIDEDLHLDYKAGAILDRDPHRTEVGSPTDFKGKLCKHVAGFANGNGGVLVLGVGEAPRLDDGAIDRKTLRPLAPCLLDAATLGTRIRDALQQLRLSLHPPPRIHALDCNGGSIGVIAVARAEGAVFCLEREQRVYYVRLHDSTAGAPAYLVEDVLLGRRRRPMFDLALSEVRLVREDWGFATEFGIRVTNTGLVWMHSVRAALVGYFDQPHAPEVGEVIGSYLDVRGQGAGPSRPGVRWFDVGPVAVRDHLGPFEALTGTLPKPTVGIRGHQNQLYWCGAILVLSLDQPPIWYQVVLWRTILNGG
ncbi:MAG: ATP-binding protein [Myxococcota bacterium]